MRTASLWCCLLCACAGSAARSETAQGPTKAGAAGPAQVAASPVLAVEQPAYIGVVERKGLVAMLERGMGHLLSHLQLESQAAPGAFSGFRVAALDPAWQDAGLQVGDLILRLNGQRIERPEQAQAALNSLRTASEIRVEILRDGAPAQLRYLLE